MKKSKLILIIARKGSKDNVSRQNLRLVNEKPLIYYIINTARKYQSADVFVSTDSEELKEIALSNNVKVIKRPKSLIKDSTTLEEISYHVLNELKKMNKNYEKCLVLHPKFPLIEVSTINRFFSQLSKQKKCVFGFTSNNEHIFQKINSRNQILLPLKNHNHNIVKQEKIVAFDCEFLIKNKSFPIIKHGIKIPESEFLELDSYHAFGTFEKIITRKKILIRVHGSVKIGLGHVYNMLTILNHLRNEELLIVMDKKSSLGSIKFKEQLYNLKYFSNEQKLFRIIARFKPDIIFNDILDTSSNYMKKLKKTNSFLVNFEDLGEGRKYADLIFNPIFNTASKNFKILTRSHKKLKNEFFGSDYACVRDEFRMWKREGQSREVKNILISFGGADPCNHTMRILNIFYNSKYKNIKLIVILGIGYSAKKKLQSLIKKMERDGFHITIIEKSDFLAKHIRKADFAIASNGRTIFEIAALDVPLIGVSVKSIEQNHSFIEDAKVGFHVNFYKKIDEKLMLKRINQMMSFKTRQKFIQNLEKINLLDGINRVIDKIMHEYEIKK